MLTLITLLFGGSMRRHWFIVTSVLCLTSNRVCANTDINNLFDARSTGMGATGVAHLDSAGAIPINPAALDQVDKMALTLDGTLIVVQQQAPYVVTHPEAPNGVYENYETIRFGRTVAPLFLVGGAARVHERVVLGAAFYPIIGMGTISKYRPAPELRPGLEVSNELAAGLLEIGVPISVRVVDNLSLALSWRVTSFTQTATQPVSGNGVGRLFLGPSGDPVYARLDVNGWNFGGFQAGLLYKPLPFLRVGLSYRSKVTVTGTGVTTSTNPLDGSSVALETRAPFTSPHTFRGGLAVSSLHDKLLFAFDFKYAMYAEAFKTIDTTIVMNGVPRTEQTVTNWKDAYALLFGAEYAVLPILRVRAGYELVTSATPNDYAKNNMAPPGVSHGISLGLGLAMLDRLSVDIAGVYIAYETRVEQSTQTNSGPGIYGSNTGQIGLSATYRM